MKTVLIVDGYNAINAIKDTQKLLKDNLLSARSRIIMLVQEYVRSSGYISDFCVVFDGQDRYRHLERLYVPASSKQSFSGTGEGDEKIIETIRQYSSRPGVKLIVASNDNYVRNNARGYGASIMDSEELSGIKKKSRQRERSSSQGPDRKEIPPDIKEKITREYRRELGL
ncbi:MAG TPA: NYN domain-containing protein [Candidatus Omnitrophota bacterium]|nr:NYN domain-containing protein [Candidatus Omnitrophota bacterium]